jgi:hypothetical protein
MDKLSVQPLSDITADGHSVASMTTVPETFEQIMEQIDAFLSPPPLIKKMEAVYPKLAALESSFYTRFPKFKLSPPLYRWVAATSKLPAHYEIKITFVWSEYEIPRFGTLSYTAKPSFYGTWEVEFAPWNSEGKSGTETINWTKLHFVDFFPPLRAIERILLESFRNESPPPPAKAYTQLENQ